MKIAIFTDTYLPNVDGVAVHLALYKREFEKLGHEVYIFVPGTKKQKAQNKDPKIHYFTSAAFKPYPDYKIALFPFISTTNIIREIKPDIIHSHGIAMTGIAAFRVAKKLGIPHLVTFHTKVTDATHYISEHESIKNVVDAIAKRYLKWYYNNFQKVIAPTEYAKKILEKYDVKNIVVLPSGIDLERFNGKKPKKNIIKKLNIKGRIVLFVGRIVKEKNIDLLIDAAETLANKEENVTFLIVGKGPAEEYYKEMVKSRNIDNVVFTGYIDNKFLPEIYYYSDVFAFPSKFDTQGLVVLEAMAMGLPVIAPKESAPAEFIEEGKNGYLFNDNKDLTEKILLTLKNREKFRKKAIAKARKYGLKKMVKELLNLYEVMIKNNKK